LQILFEAVSTKNALATQNLVKS